MGGRARPDGSVLMPHCSCLMPNAIPASNTQLARCELTYFPENAGFRFEL